MKGVINASDGELESAASSCETWAKWCGSAVVLGLIIEVALAAKHPPFDSFVGIWGSVIGDSLVALGVFGELLFSAMGSKRHGELQRRSKLMVAELNAQAHEATLRASEATQKAQEAILELARLKAPRFIEPEQIDLIADNLSKYSGTQFDLAISVPDPEIYTILALIEWALQKAGWQVVDWNGPGQLEQRANGRLLAVGRGLTIGNVSIGINMGADPTAQAAIWAGPTAQAAIALAGELNAAGIEARFVFVADRQL